MPHEINTYNIITFALDNGKQIFVPDTDYRSRNMNFKQLLDLSSIATDDKGIIMLMKIHLLVMTWTYLLYLE